LVSKLEKSKEYVKSFFRAEFKPELLFGTLLDAQKLKRHPMVIWKQRHLKEWLEGKTS